jgi:hypothetical protein
MPNSLGDYAHAMQTFTLRLLKVFPSQLGDFVGGDIIVAKKYEHKKIFRL